MPHSLLLSSNRVSPYSICTVWYIAWKLVLKNIPFMQDMMGVNRWKKKMHAEEIEQIRQQHAATKEVKNSMRRRQVQKVSKQISEASAGATAS